MSTVQKACRFFRHFCVYLANIRITSKQQTIIYGTCCLKELRHSGRSKEHLSFSGYCVLKGEKIKTKEIIPRYWFTYPFIQEIQKKRNMKTVKAH